MYECLADLQERLQPDLKKIHNYLTQHNLTLAVAESVTAGCIQLLCSTAEEAQQFFQGGITVYNCAQKAVHLGVEPVFASNCNGVDQSIADRLAQNVCGLFRSQIGLGITGYATMVPEEGINELYAYICIASGDSILIQERVNAVEQGIEAQWHYAEAALQLLAKILMKRS